MNHLHGFPFDPIPTFPDVQPYNGNGGGGGSPG